MRLRSSAFASVNSAAERMARGASPAPMRREKGSGRPALTPEQRAIRPPVHHPLFLTHPLTGRKVLYCNPGYAVRIEGMPEAESDAMLEFLFQHQLQAKYRYDPKGLMNPGKMATFVPPESAAKQHEEQPA